MSEQVERLEEGLEIVRRLFDGERLEDGLWTLADPEMAPDVIDAYKGACEDAGKEGDRGLRAQVLPAAGAFATR